MQKEIGTSYSESLQTIRDFCSNPDTYSKTNEICAIIAKAFQNGNKLLIAGNGGSACDAIHFAEEFTGRFRKNRKPLPVVSFTDSAHITAVANDFGFDEIFARNVEAYARDGDIFIGISTSGNSPNILKAIEKCEHLGITAIALLGRDGGKLKDRCRYELTVPGKTSDKIQEVHMIILHIIIEGVERMLFPENYQ